LSGNYITALNPTSFIANTKLQFLTLSSNKLTTVNHLNHLEDLQALDLSNNAIEEIDLH